MLMSLGNNGLFPEYRVEEDDHGEELQTSDQHIEGKYYFREIGHDIEVLRRADQTKARSDVVQCGSNRGEGCNQVFVFEADQEHGDDVDHYVSDKVDIRGTKNIVIQGLTIHLDLLDGFRMKIATCFLDEGFD